ncbi:FkbM family methyltransferase [Sphingomonas sp. ID0503]|uniref:FkbM family methyltransferase n=1 Tax=Sphingomonas sp. ID0503 TaxID=3399691 RepID=UPI003AFB5C5A
MPKGVVHVGASTGQEVPEYAEAQLRAGLFVEPLLEPFLALEQRVAEHPQFKAVQAVCSDRDGAEVSLNVASNGGESSSILTPAAHTVLHGSVTFDRVELMQSQRLDTLCARVEQASPGFIDQIDTLVMDVQGAELLVLKGAVETLRQINYVYSEVSLLDLYAGNAKLHEIIAFMRLFGFELFNCNINRKFYGDALFVRMSHLTGRLGDALKA